jgi:hypothetical protein
MVAGVKRPDPCHKAQPTHNAEACSYSYRKHSAKARNKNTMISIICRIQSALAGRAAPDRHAQAICRKARRMAGAELDAARAGGENLHQSWSICPVPGSAA